MWVKNKRLTIAVNKKSESTMKPTPVAPEGKEKLLTQALDSARSVLEMVTKLNTGQGCPDENLSLVVMAGDALDKLHQVAASLDKDHAVAQKDSASRAILIPQEIITLLGQAAPTPWKVNDYRPFSLISRDPNEQTTAETGDHKFKQFVHFAGSFQEQKNNSKLVEFCVNFVAQLAKSVPLIPAPATQSVESEFPPEAKS